MSLLPNGTNAACKSDDSHTCLTSADTAGLTMQFAASLLSFGAIVYTFIVIVLRSINRRGSWTSVRIFYYPMDILIFAVLLADLVQAIGGLLSIKWIQDGIVELGTFCDVQGITKIFGETQVAFSTLLVAIYTFATVATGMGPKSMKLTAAFVFLLWSFIAILVGIGYGVNGTSSSSRFLAPAPYWCWVRRAYTTWMIMSEYLWLWIAALTSLLLYIPLYLWMRGNLDFRDDVWYMWSIQRKSPNIALLSSRRKALIMLVYPAVYCVCVIPLSVVRWMTFVDDHKYGTSSMPPAATFAVITIFNLSGFFNVILIFTTRPNLGLFGRQESSPQEVGAFSSSNTT